MQSGECRNDGERENQEEKLVEKGEIKQKTPK